MTSEPSTGPGLRKYELSQRFQSGAGPVVLTGLQALPRLLVEQHVRDKRSGLHTASLVSGYPGSPFAGVDKALAQAPELTHQHGMRFVPGLNEELAATAVWGSQSALPTGSRAYDGVVGIWFGKGPGADRSGDVLRHGNLYGADPKGGVLVLVGDDPGAKSSTVPCASERSLSALGMPVLFPRNSEEMIVFGLYGIELSRASGCWVGVKVVADVADGLWSVDNDFSALSIQRPRVSWQGRPWTYQQRVMQAPTDCLAAEADLVGPRWEMVQQFAALNPFDQVEVDTTDAWLGVAATGTAFDHTRQALRDLGLDDAGLRRAGIRLLRIGMPYPLGGAVLRRFAGGLRELVVIEEKTAFVETQVRDILYGTSGAPRVLGKRGRDGDPLIPADGALTADRLAAPLRSLLGGNVQLAAPRKRLPLISPNQTSRIPYFCSGCPHNRSTTVPEGSLAAGGIGCHTMVTIVPREASQVTSLTQMGGEGAQWIGQAPFTDIGHIFQNLGDGTLFHSGQLAIQACIAAGVNITYKILYNSAVAMTGAQDAQGALDVPTLTRKLHAEGVARIIICADDPGRYSRRAARKKHLGPGVLVWHRDRLDEAQRLLREVAGVTVIIYDQRCAAEARRLRKRGKLPPATKRVVINEAVCEGCGDCGAKSNCLSVQPVDTDFGRKTRIDQSSCNVDFSCLAGDCPSFVTVDIDPSQASTHPAPPPPPAVPEPRLPAIDSTYDIYLAGIGGTGIVTVNQVLATAALQQGLRCAGLDQTGLSQKAGPVTSHLRLSHEQPEPANRLSDGAADCYLVFDLMVAAEPTNLRRCDPARTAAIASTSPTPTGTMVYDPTIRYPRGSQLLGRIGTACRRVASLDALGASLALFDTTEVANLLVVGGAYQAGLLPMSAAAIESAITINGVAVQANIAAFRWGRVAVADPDAFTAATSPPPAVPVAAALDPERWVAETELLGETRRLAGVLAAQLHAHSGPSAVRRFIELVESAAQAERLTGAGTAYSCAVARGLHRFMAYKDEYEVARLLTDPTQMRALTQQVPGARRVSFNLHPPTLRGAGLGHKITLGPMWRPVLRGLAKGRALRGTPFDPFGHTRIRRIERALIDDYVDLIGQLQPNLPKHRTELAATIADTADLVRGFEEVKLRGVQAYRMRRAELGYPIGTALADLLDH
ncbi:indolepyruvate ferredoxin oxidoreductase family protein [Mycobacterium sp. E796]|uniref:indolepyruvate ferredoxin oxidoreductase family protein n=1 Tax=Mycobacterium sp. E796 TaxID=1834151 RepID=UPI0008002B1B|nr:indolepyruvate ferredoxin oxidoreductase family protein [Mycobacterium sp. E796]OBI40504.1 indolepyruvate ferredoxin oxidoreductase [Mycobacterium sp. E796]